jgi:hypothetical protein
MIKDNITLNEYDSVNGGMHFRVAILSLKTTPDVSSDLPYPVTLRGVSAHQLDVTFLYLTRNVSLPDYDPAPFVVGLGDEEHLQVYPNPFSVELFVESSSPTKLIIFDNTGRPVLKATTQKGKAIDTSALLPGLYILNLVNDVVSRKTKLVKSE